MKFVTGLRKLLAETKDESNELNKEYYYFQANEDIARITLFTNHALHTLYRFLYYYVKLSCNGVGLGG